MWSADSLTIYSVPVIVVLLVLLIVLRALDPVILPPPPITISITFSVIIPVVIMIPTTRTGPVLWLPVITVIAIGVIPATPSRRPGLSKVLRPIWTKHWLGLMACIVRKADFVVVVEFEGSNTTQLSPS